MLRKRHVLFGQKYMGIFQKHEKSSPNGGAHQTVNRHSGMEQPPLPLPLGEVAE